MPTLSWGCPGPAEEQSCILEPSQQPHPCALGLPAVTPQCWIQVLDPSEAPLGCTDTSFQPFSQHRGLSQPMLQPTWPCPTSSPSPQPLSVPAAMKSGCPAEQPDTQLCCGTTCSEAARAAVGSSMSPSPRCSAASLVNWESEMKHCSSGREELCPGTPGPLPAARTDGSRWMSSRTGAQLVAGGQGSRGLLRA